ncbi:hypothetical protein D0Z08_24730 [Nocardioides immobilis]|uniref:Type IV toxin-antitoxin system AbiEi family antitoxin domain-containing protein n=2 Tax=Nocardioides immobilis TaxID=2049295 RepID=A0A417XVE9_9ACTN|nr:hypothetical protein D0Z08_24730 [Nocardioides immobilis]
MYVKPDDPRLLPISLRSELLAAGESDRSLARAIRTGSLERPRRGAYVDGELWRSMTDEERYAVRCRAAYRQAEAEVFLSHASSLPLLDGPLWGLELGDAHLTRFDGKAGRRQARIRQHCGAVSDGDVVSAHGTRFSSPMRSALEVTMVGSVESGLVVANHFLHRGDFTLAQLQERYDGAMTRWPFSLKTDLVVRLADPRIESVGESRTFHFLWAWHFPRPDPQFKVYDNGLLVARLDFALPEHHVWIEFDGKVKYQGSLRDGDDVTAVVLREKRREERIAEITGWRCLRITWADLANPARLAARLRNLIDSVARSRRPR